MRAGTLSILFNPISSAQHITWHIAGIQAGSSKGLFSYRCSDLKGGQVQAHSAAGTHGGETQDPIRELRGAAEQPSPPRVSALHKWGFMVNTCFSWQVWYCGEPDVGIQAFLSRNVLQYCWHRPTPWHLPAWKMSAGEAWPVFFQTLPELSLPLLLVYLATLL